MFRAIIADDERLARKRLRELLKAHPEVEVAGEAENLDSLIAVANHTRADLVFLDIQMPPHSGFDALPHLEANPKVVFVTAYDQFAVRAFETNAFDYLLKPVHPKRLAETIRRLHVQRMNATPANPLVTVKDRGIIRQIPLDSLAAIEAEGDYTRLFLRNEKPFLILRSLQEWEAALPSPPYVRLDRSLLVNLDLVRSARGITRNETHLFLEGLPEAMILRRAASLRLKRLLPF